MLVSLEKNGCCYYCCCSIPNWAYDVSLMCSSRVYLHDVYAGVQVDGPFGVLAVLLVLVGVEDVGAVWELRQVEVPPLEHLQFTAKQVREVQV